MFKNYKINMYGVGGEIVMGFIKPEIYNYFKNNNIKVENYIFDTEIENSVPIEYQPFIGEQWYECDNIAHNYGVEMSHTSRIEVTDENDEIIFNSELESSELENHDCKFEVYSENYISNFQKGSTIFFARTIEKGHFFDGELEINDPFEPSKLKFIFMDIEGIYQLKELQYENIEVSNSGGSTRTVDSYYDLLISEIENSYKNDYSNSELTDWINLDSKPHHVGVYEVQFSNGRAGTTLATWDGEDFREITSLESPDPINSDTLHGISHWRGLNYQP